MFSVTSQYALRALAHLAAAPRDTPVLGSDLARETGVPANYLRKILLAMGNAGIIEASRGSGGGYRLARKPSRIRVGEVVDLFDHSMSDTPCLLGLRKVCSDANPCSAHRSWRRTRLACQDFLKNTTLADISADRWG